MREQVTRLPSARSILAARTVLPHPLKGTGHPCAFTENVLATPKSLLDCMTAGEKPIASSFVMIVDHRAPALTRYRLALVSASSHCWSSVVTVPPAARLWPPIECRAALAMNGRPAERASAIAARMRSTAASGASRIVTWDATRVGESRLASLSVVGPLPVRADGGNGGPGSFVGPRH